MCVHNIESTENPMESTKKLTNKWIQQGGRIQGDYIKVCCSSLYYQYKFKVKLRKFNL